MLVQVCKKNDVVVLKMKTGEEIIGSLESNDTTKYVQIYKPLKVIITSDGTASFVPWCIAVDFDTRLAVRADALAADPVRASQDYARAYTQSCSSLTLPS